MFPNHNNFSNFNSNFSNFYDMKNLQEYSVTKNCCSDLSLSELIVLVIASDLQKLWDFFLIVGQNNFGDKMPWIQTAATLSFLHNQCSGLTKSLCFSKKQRLHMSWTILFSTNGMKLSIISTLRVIKIGWLVFQKSLTSALFNQYLHIKHTFPSLLLN